MLLSPKRANALNRQGTGRLQTLNFKFENSMGSSVLSCRAPVIIWPIYKQWWCSNSSNWICINETELRPFDGRLGKKIKVQ